MLENAPGNCILTSSKIQNDIISVCARETTMRIINELDGGLFAILADESADISDKEQMALCLRYVDKLGKVQERLLGVVHVGNTTSLTLKTAIDSLFVKFGLTYCRVRGQGYDGASNMCGEISGLKTLILQECECAYYVHCFAHQLQLTLVAVANKNDDCGWLFGVLTNMVNVVGGSCKRREILREKQAERVMEGIELGEIETGTGLNQELGLCRPCDTRWSSHFKTILHMLSLYRSVLDVIHTIAESSEGMFKASVESLAFNMKLFDFVFAAHLMVSVFGITNQLNMALQKREQDIVNAMGLVNVTKERLQALRDDGWDSHLEKVVSFCGKNNISVCCMDDSYALPGRVRRGHRNVTNLHHFRVEVFFGLIDQILLELDDRFGERSKELLICMSAFCPQDRFASFDTKKLLRLAEFYPKEFSEVDLMYFEYQLETFLYDVRADERFSGLKNLNELSVLLVETKKHITHSKVYLLLKLVLLLPVATATVERAFSAMKKIKSKVRNSMSNELLNNDLVTYIERDIFGTISIDELSTHFQNMRTRRAI